MKKSLFVLAVVLFVVACTGSKKDQKASEDMSLESTTEFVTYKFKVDGLQDSIVSDSIWRIIFQVEGIDKLVLSRDDSLAIFTIDPKLVDKTVLEKEIASRGGVLLD